MRVAISVVAVAALLTSSIATAKIQPCSGRLVYQNKEAFPQVDARKISNFDSSLMRSWGNGSMTMHQVMTYVLQNYAHPNIDQSKVVFLEFWHNGNTSFCMVFVEK